MGIEVGAPPHPWVNKCCVGPTGSYTNEQINTPEPGEGESLWVSCPLEAASCKLPGKIGVQCWG